MYRHCGAIGGNSDHRDPLINESQDQESMDREVRTSRDWVGLIGRIIIVLATRWRTDMSYEDNRATSWRIQWKFLWYFLVCRKLVAVISTIRWKSGSRIKRSSRTIFGHVGRRV